MLDHAASFLDSATRRFPRDAELSAAWGLIVNQQRAGPSTLVAALTGLARGRAIDAQNVSVNAAIAITLVKADRVAEALPFFRAALKTSPFDYGTRAAYWEAVQGQAARPADERRREVEADVAVLLAARPAYPGALAIAAYGAYGLPMFVADPAKTVELEERVLRDAPTSPRADMIAVLRMARWRDSTNLARTHRDSVRFVGTMDAEFAAFIARPRRPVLGMLRWALNTRLGIAIQDSATPSSTIVALGREAIAVTPPGLDVVYSRLPMALAARKTELTWAEQLVRVRDSVAQRGMVAMRPMMATLGDFANFAEQSAARFHDELGWIFFSAGRIADAERELDKALAIRPRHAAALYHRGVVAEARGDERQATGYYSRGFQQEVSGTAKQSTSALRRLHAKGGDTSAAGFAQYTRALVESARARRKADLLAAKPEVKRIPSFDLVRLSGGRMSSAELRGRIAIVTTWGVWCGPCVSESPDLERFYQKYKGDSTVVLVTVDAFDARDVVERFIASRKLTFPVLLDDGWTKRARTGGFPTTLFIDPDGNVVFTSHGSEDLVEEYTWLVEAIKARASK